MASDIPFEYDAATTLVSLLVQFESDTENFRALEWLKNIPLFSDDGEYRDENLWHDITTVPELLKGYPAHWPDDVCHLVGSDEAQQIVKSHPVINKVCNHGANARIVKPNTPGHQVIACTQCGEKKGHPVYLVTWVGKMLGIEGRYFKRVSTRNSLSFH